MSDFYHSFLYRIGLSDYQPIPETASAPTSRPPNPKGFLANERTLLSWLNFSLILGTVSVALLNFAGDSLGSLIAASLFGVVAVGLLFISYYNFRWRAKKLKNLELGYYDDLATPIGLVVAVVLAVAVNFWVHFIAQIL